jgi:hypothetical protein
MHVPSSLSRMMMSGLLSGMVLSVCTCLFCNMFTLPQLRLPACSHKCSLSNFTPASLHMLQCSSGLCMYRSVAHTGQADIPWSTASSNCWQFPSALIFCLQYVSCNILY